MRKKNCLLLLLLFFIGTIVLAAPHVKASSVSSKGTETAEEPFILVNKLTMIKGQKAVLRVFDNTKYVPKYSSSDKKIATVTQDGTVEALKKGKCTITVKVGNQKLKCKITVKNAYSTKTLNEKITFKSDVVGAFFSITIHNELPVSFYISKKYTYSYVDGSKTYDKERKKMFVPANSEVTYYYLTNGALLIEQYESDVFYPKYATVSGRIKNMEEYNESSNGSSHLFISTNKKTFYGLLRAYYIENNVTMDNWLAVTPRATSPYSESEIYGYNIWCPAYQLYYKGNELVDMHSIALSHFDTDKSFDGYNPYYGVVVDTSKNQNYRWDAYTIDGDLKMRYDPDNVREGADVKIVCDGYLSYTLR